MKTHASRRRTATHFIINGEKLWCTNGIKAGVIVVMAKTPHGEAAAARSPPSSWR